MLSSWCKKKVSLYVLLFVAFIDYLGIGLVYPLFSYLMLNKEAAFLPEETSDVVRGMSLGILISLYSIGQFFSGPILGKLSDKIGRKKVLTGCLSLCVVGYLVSIIGIEWMSLPILLLSRFIIGTASGSAAVVQASIADVSTQENKSQHYALYGMFLGIGFSVGPYLGGILSNPSFFQGYSLPFWTGGLLCLINLLLVMACYQETHFNLNEQKIKLLDGLTQIKKISQMKEIRLILLTIFIYIFGWSFYFEFIPLYLMNQFNYNATSIGNFYAFSTGCYALFSGVLIMPLLKRFKLDLILFCSLLFLGMIVFAFLFIQNPVYLLAYLPIQAYIAALILPASTSLVSNSVDQESQGEALGIFQSVQSMAWALAPLLSGSLLCIHPFMPIFVGGTSITIASLIFGIGTVALFPSFSRQTR